MAAESLKGKTVRGTVWSVVERFSVQGVMFVVMIFMARVLTPADYGLVGMVAIFIAVSQSLVDSGFSQALIRKKNRTETDNSTVFYFNVAVGLALYLILFFCAPLIAKFYKEPLLIPITRLVSLSIVINSLVVVQRALLITKIDFKTQAKASFIAVVVSGAVGLTMAYTGWGVWAIVWYQLTNISVNMGLLWVMARWRPHLLYSWQSFREMFSFGSKLALSGIINTLYNNIYLLVIGKVYKAADLGYYTRAHHFAELPSSTMTNVLQRVTYPVMCSIQDDLPRLTDIYIRLLKISGFVIFPLMTVLAAVSRPLILSILTPQWLFSAELLTILCFTMMWYPIHAINLNLLQVRGRSDLFLRLEIIKKIISAGVLCATVSFGLVVMCIGSVFNSILALVINTYYTGKLINVGFVKQMKALMPTLLLSLATGAITYLTLYFLPLRNGLLLAIGLVEGAVIYVGGSRLFRFDEFREIMDIVRRKKN